MWLLCLLQLLVGLGWSVANPPLRGLDEAAQVDLARHLADGDPYPDQPGALTISEAMIGAQHVDEEETETPPAAQEWRVAGDWRADGAFRDIRFRVEEAESRLARPSFDGMEAPPPGVDGAHVPNRAADQPPLAALAGAAVLTAVPDTAPYDVQGWLLRVLSALVAAPLPLLAYLATRWLLDDRRAALTAATVPLAVPTLSHLAGAGSAAVWLATGGGILALGVSRLALGDTRLLTGLLLGVALGVGALTHVVGLVWPLAVLAAGVVGVVRGGASPLQAGTTVGFAAALTGVLGGWWWLLRPPSPAVLEPVGIVRGPAEDGLGWLATAVWWLLQGFLGRIGWDELALWNGAVLALLVVLIGAALAAVVGRRRPGPSVRAALLCQLVVVVGSAAVALVGAGMATAERGVMVGPDGHLLLGGLVGLAVVASAGLIAGLGRWARLVAPGTLVVATVLQLQLLVGAFRRWWGPEELDPVVALRASTTWAAVPIGTQLVIGLAVGVGLLVTGWALTRQTATARPTPAEGGISTRRLLVGRDR